MQRINWDSYTCKVEAMYDIKVNMINLLFNFFSNSDLNSVCFKYFNDERGEAVEELIFGCVMGLDGRIPHCML